MASSFEQDDLKKLSRSWYGVHDQLSRDQPVKGLRPVNEVYAARDTNEILYTAAESREQMLNGLELLQQLLRIDTYRGRTREISRNNIMVVSRLGGVATHEIFKIAEAKSSRLTPVALSGLQKALGIVHDRMYDTFLPIARPHSGDSGVVNHLKDSARILGRDKNIPTRVSRF